MKKIDDTKQLGLLIRSTRKRQNLTQEQLAAAAGVGVRFVRELEQGKESCHLGKAMIVVSMLGLQLSILEEDTL
ncbi:MAG: helix-turn-helix transcriptional regulator [Legionellales bacterium]|nr:helix-turn-helix transcriptional regulator [Legionellales bacterium]